MCVCRCTEKHSTGDFIIWFCPPWTCEHKQIAWSTAFHFTMKSTLFIGSAFVRHKWKCFRRPLLLLLEGTRTALPASQWVQLNPLSWLTRPAAFEFKTNVKAPGTFMKKCIYVSLKEDYLHRTKSHMPLIANKAALHAFNTQYIFHHSKSKVQNKQTARHPVQCWTLISITEHHRVIRKCIK